MVKILFDLSEMDEELAEVTAMLGTRLKLGLLSDRQVEEINKILDQTK